MLWRRLLRWLFPGRRGDDLYRSVSAVVEHCDISPTVRAVLSKALDDYRRNAG